jgi:hypothetical protein
VDDNTMAKNTTRESQLQLFRNLYQNFAGTPMSVSSESWVHKALRYAYISKVFEKDDNFSIHDIGMGMADFFSYIKEHYPQLKFDYSGTEIVPEFYEEAMRKYPGTTFFLRDIAEEIPSDTYDYVVMSGVFHQRRENRIRDWEEFSQNLLYNAFQMSKKALAFNFITPFVDFYQTDVYYCNLPKLLNFIVDKLGRFFTLYHNYALYEFTAVVWKPEYIASLYPEPELSKYFGR